MTALVVREEKTAIAHRVDVLEGVTFGDLVAMGEQLARTGFLPDHIKTGPQFAAIVMTGKELGMAPMRAVRSLQMVKGKVVEDAASQLARFKTAGGRATFDTLDETRAVITLTHPNGDKHTETWTLDDAKKAGLLGGMVGKYPKAMLRSRAITAGLKSIGWDGAVGAYDPSELVDVHEPEPIKVVVQEQPKRDEMQQRTIDLAYAIVHDLGPDDMTYARREAERVTDDSERGLKMRAALVEIIDRREMGEEYKADPAKAKLVATLDKYVAERRNGL